MFYSSRNEIRIYATNNGGIIVSLILLLTTAYRSYKFRILTDITVLISIMPPTMTTVVPFYMMYSTYMAPMKATEKLFYVLILNKIENESLIAFKI